MSRLYDLRRWRNGRVRHLRAHPMCAHCHGIAQVVDHEPPHNGNADAFFDESTWVSLCKTCHDSKTCARDGGLGNRKLAAGKRKPRKGCSVDGWPTDPSHHWCKG